MALAEYGACPTVDPLMKKLERLELTAHALELEAYGFTVVPAEKTRSSEGFIERLRDAILRTCEKRNAVTIGDFRTAAPPPGKTLANSWDLLEEDEVFVEAAINDVVLALTRWLLGQSARFSGQTWIIKGQGADGLGLHSDAHGIPPGGGHIAHMCNASWLCTDYGDGADGPTVFVPGSHRYGRATLSHEADLRTTAFATIPLIAEAGSLAIWNGATWHAAARRTNPGLRVTLVQNYMRSYMRVQKDYERTSPALLKKYPTLRTIIGESLYPYEDPQNPDPSRIAPFLQAGTDPYA